MRLLRPMLLALMLSTTAVGTLILPNLSQAATAEDLSANSRQALQTLYDTNPAAAAISKKARAILIFPTIVKAGLVFGGSYGEGTLIRGGKLDGYYNSVSPKRSSIWIGAMAGKSALAHPSSSSMRA